MAVPKSLNSEKLEYLQIVNQLSELLLVQDMLVSLGRGSFQWAGVALHLSQSRPQPLILLCMKVFLLTSYKTIFIGIQASNSHQVV